MFISSAYATTTQAAPAAAQGGLGAVLLSFLPLILVILVFYLFLVRPQQKRMAEFQKLVAGLRRGDRVVTTGGLIGTIHRVEASSTEVVLEIAENVRVRIQRNAVAEVLARTEPANDTASADSKSA